MTSAIACPCSITQAHEAHFYVSAIVSGHPGSVPSVTCICPGVI